MKAAKDKFKGDLLLFCKIVRPKAFYRPFAPVHRDIASILVDKNILYSNIIVPRGIAKTTISAQVYPLYHVFVEDRHMDRPKTVVIVSKTQGHSIKCLASIKNVLEYGKNFRTLFGYHGEGNAQTWKEDEIVLDTGDSFVAKGMGNPIRGVNYDSARPTLILCDDPEDENNTKTAEAMESNLDWLLGGALPALDSDIGKFVLIGTPLHQRCLVETLAKAPNWHTIRRKYLIENEDGTKESLWPEDRSVEFLLQERENLNAIGKVSKWYSERQCQIVGDEDQLFKPAYIKHWNGEYFRKGDDSFIRKDGIVLPINVFMGVDPASSTSARADYTVIFAVGIDSELNRYCLQYVRRRMDPMTVADNIERMYNFYKPQRTRIESTGYQEMLRSYLKSKTYIPGLEIKEIPRNSKSSRLESLQPEFAQGKVFLHENMTEFEEELLMFPKASHDDTLDAYFYAVKNVYPPYHAVESSMTDEPLEFFSSTDWMLS